MPCSHIQETKQRQKGQILFKLHWLVIRVAIVPPKKIEVFSVLWYDIYWNITSTSHTSDVHSS